jgi:copper(I)-binding protein
MGARRIAAILLLALLPPVAGARDCAPQVREGWVRLLPGGMQAAHGRMHAGFGRLVNPCPMPVTIVGARSPAYAAVELHETRIVNGVSRMRAVPELRLAPDAAAVLKPGGLHLMLLRPHAPLRAGSRVVIEFELQDGGVLRGEFEAKKKKGPE